MPVSRLSGRLKWLYHFLASKGLALSLFGILCLILIPWTLAEETGIYINGILRGLLGLVGLNLLLCTLLRMKTLSKPVIIMHLGTILTLLGTVIDFFGFVATVNIYEGTTVDKVYRWDINEDISLGMELALKKINIEYYPTPVKVGVLKGKEKVGLFILKTGESFNLESYEVKVEALEFPSEVLKLNIFNKGHLIGSADTSGVTDLPPGFPYRFVLVAFKNPSLKRMWVDLRLLKGSEIIAEGTSEVNSPFSWEGLRFHHVQIARDPYGIPYAGIQITKDPGRPYIFFGFAIMGLGSILYLLKRVYGFK
jgi:hypothetical protein